MKLLALATAITITPPLAAPPRASAADLRLHYDCATATPKPGLDTTVTANTCKAKPGTPTSGMIEAGRYPNGQIELTTTRPGQHKVYQCTRTDLLNYPRRITAMGCTRTDDTD
ncbi:hypothetical protein [Actinomadura harenae]|uniref:Uncharacterized protein n=1 Tax=Actinomadura harenae TaxID=2483351 RepID=A0A3M2LL66_9ACTN|nr:hypothetical protein [Actinomadura harenae]RMI37866.1 hypothetical protein EBO15_34610 [Actinomadura harenae]